MVDRRVERVCSMGRLPLDDLEGVQDHHSNGWKRRPTLLERETLASATR